MPPAPRMYPGHINLSLRHVQQQGKPDALKDVCKCTCKCRNGKNFIHTVQQTNAACAYATLFFNCPLDYYTISSGFVVVVAVFFLCLCTDN